MKNWKIRAKLGFFFAFFSPKTKTLLSFYGDERKFRFFCGKTWAKTCEIKKTALVLHSLKAFGPFVYRLGLQIFILARGVRFPYGLLGLRLPFGGG